MDVLRRFAAKIGKRRGKQPSAPLDTVCDAFSLKRRRVQRSGSRIAGASAEAGSSHAVSVSAEQGRRSLLSSLSGLFAHCGQLVCRPRSQGPRAATTVGLGLVAIVLCLLVYSLTPTGDGTDAPSGQALQHSQASGGGKGRAAVADKPAPPETISDAIPASAHPAIRPNPPDRIMTVGFERGQSPESAASQAAWLTGTIEEGSQTGRSTEQWPYSANR